MPAILFGFPLMFLAPYAATSDLAALITCIIAGAAFVILNIVLFRRTIFKKRFAARAAADDRAESDIAGDSLADGGGSSDAQDSSPDNNE